MCDCKKDHSDKLKGIAEKLRRMLISMKLKGRQRCLRRIMDFIVDSSQWYENYDYDGCRSEHDCETEETPNETGIVAPWIERKKRELSPDDR